MPPAKPKSYSARSRADLAALSERQNGLQVIAQLSTRDAARPASKWIYRHLIVYRLLIKPTTELLDIFDDDHDNCPFCNPGNHCSQELDPGKTSALTDKCPRNLITCTESDLMRLRNGGAFWAALAQAVRPEFREAAQQSESQRQKKPVKREGYVCSLKNISPSGLSNSSSSGDQEYEDDPAELHEDEHGARRNKPEDITVHLVRCFLQYALTSCLRQNFKAGLEVRVRLERNRATAGINNAGITAEDDGGICRMRRTENGWEMENPLLALIEAKRAFQGIYHDDKTESFEPIVSDTTIAQYLGEAVITWKANRESLGRDVFLIAATNTYLRFVHIRFGADYEEYLDANKTDQKRLIKDRNRDTCVRMQCSDWFDLNQQQGREDALCQLLALLRWHDAQLARRQGEGSDEYTSGEDSEGSSEESD